MGCLDIEESEITPEEGTELMYEEINYRLDINLRGIYFFYDPYGNEHYKDPKTGKFLSNKRVFTMIADS